MKNNIIYIIIIWLFALSCKEESKTPVIAPINEKLAIAAKEGITYYNHYYTVVTDSNVRVYKEHDGIYTEASFFLHRGDVIEVKAKNKHDFYPINIPDSTNVFYIKTHPGFNQILEGMRFPVVGIIKSEGVYAVAYDMTSQSYEKEDLKVGTTYFFEIKKDIAYVNYWSEKLNKPVTATLSGTDDQLHIIQKEDHRSILKKYETSFKITFD